ncbi:MAG TPA: hypothetical protein VKF36_00650 [Syntrophorhabdales bacterium]|nr:hypothetical protein [Syntrophorhabdales bacterium]
MRYQRFVLQGIDGRSPWNDLKGQIFLGDKRFIEEAKASRVLDDNLKEVGDHVRLHYTTVSRIIREQHRMLQRKT